MIFSNWLKKKFSSDEYFSPLPLADIGRESFDVSNNPFKFLDRRVEELIFFDGAIAPLELEKKVRYASRFNDPSSTWRRRVVVCNSLKLLLSEKLKIIKILIFGTAYLEALRRNTIQYHSGNLPSQLEYFQHRIIQPYSVKLPAELSWDMPRGEILSILGVPNHNKIYSLSPPIPLEDTMCIDMYFFAEGCMELFYNNSTQKLEYLEIYRLPNDLDEAIKQSLHSYPFMKFE